jgi:hypothetical protein
MISPLIFLVKKMKKTTVTLLLISMFGLKYSNANALSLFDFKACELHHIEYTLVLNDEQCPLVPWHEKLVSKMSSEDNTEFPFIGASIAAKPHSVLNTNMDASVMMSLEAKINKFDTSILSKSVELYTEEVHNNHCYSSHPGDM